MNSARRFLAGLRALLFSSRVDRELDDELRQFEDAARAANEAAGMSREAARRAARVQIGSTAAAKDHVRDIGWESVVTSLWRELTMSMRGLVHRPVVALSVILTLGLGIGATTTIFSVVDGVLFRPLPYDTPDSLVTVGPVNTADQWIDPSVDLQRLSLMSFPDFAALSARGRPFDALAAIQVNSSVLSDVGDGPEAIQVGIVSPQLFRLLGAVPAVGRLFLPEEYSIAAPRVAMITYQSWVTRYGRRDDVLNRPIPRLPAWTVIGVLPPNFQPPEVFFPDGETPEFWTPLPVDDARRAGDQRGRLHVLGRLAPGVSLAAARQEASGIVALRDGRRDGDPGIGVNALHAHTVGASRGALTMFFLASGLLLVLAVLNASTILLVRSLDAAREVGVRMVLGASRLRIVRATLMESGLLSLGGAALGIALAFGGVAAFLQYAPSSIPRIDGVAVDLRILGAATLVALLSGLSAGLLPALRQSATGPAEHLRKSGRASTEPAGRVRSLLLVGQIAVTVVLLSGAGLLAGSFTRMRAVDLGLDPDTLITMDVSIGAFARAQPKQFTSVSDAWDRALEALRSVPGVASVAGTTSLPLQTPAWRPDVRVSGASSDISRRSIAGYAVTPGLMETMGTRLVRGREFTSADTSASEPVALVNEAFVRSELAGREPLDSYVVRFDPATSARNDDGIPTRIVGIVEDVVQARVEDGMQPALYVPHTQHAGELQAVVRTGIVASAIAPDLRRAAARFNPLFPVQNIRTMSDRLDATLSSPRFRSLVVGAFAGAATLLAALGLYGFLAYSVRCRERELGIRAALGASRSSAVLLVLRQGLILTLAGLLVGLLATPVLTYGLATMLYGLKPGDPGTIVNVAGILVSVCAVACLIPLWRAVMVDPITILKAE